MKTLLYFLTVHLQVNPNEQVNFHFVAFVHKGGYLYELDGRKEFPINHGETDPEKLLEVIGFEYS